MEMVLPLFPRRGRGRMEIRQTVGFKRKNVVFPHIRSEGYFHGAWKNHFHAKMEEPCSSLSSTYSMPFSSARTSSRPQNIARKRRIFSSGEDCIVTNLPTFCIGNSISKHALQQREGIRKRSPIRQSQDPTDLYDSQVLQYLKIVSAASKFPKYYNTLEILRSLIAPPQLPILQTHFFNLIQAFHFPRPLVSMTAEPAMNTVPSHWRPVTPSPRNAMPIAIATTGVK